MTTKVAAKRAESRTPFAAPPPGVSEDAFLAAVIELAIMCGWRVCHVRPVLVRGSGKVRYLTPYDTRGHSGLPDLVIARGGQVLLIELKSAKGRVEPEQQLWLTAAGSNGRLWRLSDWRVIRETLRRAV